MLGVLRRIDQHAMTHRWSSVERKKEIYQLVKIPIKLFLSYLTTFENSCQPVATLAVVAATVAVVAATVAAVAE